LLPGRFELGAAAESRLRPWVHGYVPSAEDGVLYWGLRAGWSLHGNGDMIQVCDRSVVVSCWLNFSTRFECPTNVLYI